MAGHVISLYGHMTVHQWYVTSQIDISWAQIIDTAKNIELNVSGIMAIIYMA